MNNPCKALWRHIRAGRRESIYVVEEDTVITAEDFNTVVRGHYLADLWGQPSDTPAPLDHN